MVKKAVQNLKRRTETGQTEIIEDFFESLWNGKTPIYSLILLTFLSGARGRD
jgi:hypothetical protein